MRRPHLILKRSIIMPAIGKSRPFLHTLLGLGAAALAFAFADRSAAAHTPGEGDNKTVVSQSFEAWRSGTGSPFDLLADDARWTIEGNSMASKTYPTKEDFLRDVIRPFNARMAVGIKPTVRSITAEADRVVILFDARGTATDGKPYVNTYALFFRMRSGRVIEANAFFDALAFDNLWSRITPAG
jgi:ketosteroid isomerase-like protein